ncbi:transcriptional regulator [Azoarcus communis]|uniref:Mor transcription activator family protein n=1 Tax=Parazoarcus communis TaxID=41977 RepID=UPI0014593C60|nr:Mor transcription activator family protein [Parazoarcus communis]NMG48253.1 transcriptional regulator [Parazoarcus communis]
MSLMLDDDYPESLGLVANAAYTWLTENLKLEHQPAAEAAMSIAERVRKELGGGFHYIPKGRDYELSHRDRAIYGKFRGDNYQQLAREYDLTEMRIRQIVERCRAADIKSRQSGLF